MKLSPGSPMTEFEWLRRLFDGPLKMYRNVFGCTALYWLIPVMYCMAVSDSDFLKKVVLRTTSMPALSMQHGVYHNLGDRTPVGCNLVFRHADGGALEEYGDLLHPWYILLTTSTIFWVNVGPVQYTVVAAHVQTDVRLSRWGTRVLRTNSGEKDQNGPSTFGTCVLHYQCGCAFGRCQWCVERFLRVYFIILCCDVWTWERY